MTTLKLDPITHDLAVEDNKLLIIGADGDAYDEVLQRLRCRLKMIRGEWFLDVTRGTPYREEIFVKGINPDRIAAAIKREILSTSGVIQLLTYDQTINTATRLLTVNFSVQCTDGTVIEFSEEI